VGNRSRRALRVMSFVLTMNGGEGRLARSGVHRAGYSEVSDAGRKAHLDTTRRFGEVRWVPIGFCRLLIEWRSILPKARGSNRADEASRAGSSTSIASEISPRSCGKGAGCAFFFGGAQPSSEPLSGGAGEGEPSKARPVFVASASRVWVLWARKGRRRHARVARSIACAEIIVVMGLTGSSCVVSTRIGEASESSFRVCSEEHCMSAASSEGARDSVFERWAHSVDGRGGSLASGNEIAISIHAGRTKADEVTAG